MAPEEPLIGSRWQAFDGSTVGTVGVAGPEDVEVALAAAEFADQRAAKIARTISAESRPSREPNSTARLCRWT